ncbi:hypothetical protein GCM10009821_21720 [Aeromicrobium halocynthiae]|uniref:Uncharacterized protein n=1 Tax=Aeromicrobium halocynthiae TaxID=560557 RepID=A0ABN2W260_9ACTN
MAELDMLPFEVLRAGRTWRGLGEDVEQARSYLRDASSAAPELGPRVAGAVSRFFGAWEGEMSARVRAASANGEMLDAAAGIYVAHDQQSAQDLRSLLPWSDYAAICRKPVTAPITSLTADPLDALGEAP